MRIKFTTIDGRSVEYRDGVLKGDAGLVSAINSVIDDEIACGCNYWAEIDPSLETPWEAYMTVCGALTLLYAGVEPTVVGVPDNPNGYFPEGPVFDR